MTIRTRIAPSPTGMPHVGTLFQALFDYVYAKQHEGKFVIRIEDTDQERLVTDAESAIYAALEYFDVIPDEGPKYGGQLGPYRQSERLAIYKKYALQLVEQGTAYYCFCTPERLAKVREMRQKAGLPPMYDGHCRDLDLAQTKVKAKTQPHVIRLKVPHNESISFMDLLRGEIEFDSNTIDDQVLLKSDGFPTYHLGVVVDDHLMEISHMVRGEEWISSTPKHILLYRYFGWKCPAIIHTPLLRNPDHSKLSKRHGHASVKWYIDQGYLKEAVLNFLATRVWNHPEGKEVFGLDELIKHFKWEAMHIQGPIVDLDKLDWYNREWLKSLSDSDLLKRCEAYKPQALNSTVLAQILPLLKERLTKLSELPEMTRFLYEEPSLTKDVLTKESKCSDSDTASYLDKVIILLNNLEKWDVASIEQQMRSLQAESGLKPRPAFMTVRIAVTGQSATPPLFDILAILGRTQVINRLQKAKSTLTS